MQDSSVGPEVDVTDQSAPLSRRVSRQSRISSRNTNYSVPVSGDVSALPSSSMPGDASSVSVEFTRTWFSFAAPPQSRKRRVEFTR